MAETECTYMEDLLDEIVLGIEESNVHSEARGKNGIGIGCCRDCSDPKELNKIIYHAITKYRLCGGEISSEKYLRLVKKGALENNLLKCFACVCNDLFNKHMSKHIERVSSSNRPLKTIYSLLSLPDVRRYNKKTDLFKGSVMEAYCK